MSKSFTFYFLFFTFLCSTVIKAQTVTGPLGEEFNYRVVAANLSDPWEITYGPDGFLWVTEAKGYKVSRINPVNGSKITLLDLRAFRNFQRYDVISNTIDGGKPWPQGGLMGLALHPQLLSGKPFVYLAYVYYFEGANAAGNGCAGNDGGCFFKTKIVRYKYNATAQTLTSPVTLIDTLPGSNDHNGGRMTIMPMPGYSYLFYSAGDMGGGQFNNAGRSNNAQRADVYEGKILRFNLEPDRDTGYNKWIPNDNPYNIKITNKRKNDAKQSAVWSLGHRNPQGLDYGVVAGISKLYSVEHGPFSDDELNVIERKKNYGHSLIEGMNDGNYNGLAAAASANTSLPGTWQTTCPLINSENANVAAMGGQYKDPLKTFYPSANSFLTTILNAVKKNNTTTGFPNANNFTWQSEGVSSVQYYSSNAIPGWNNSLLLTTLKGGKLIRVQLNSSGDAVAGDTINYFKGANRYRDITISNDGTKIYLAIDSSAITSGPSATNPQVSTNRGSIIEFAYVNNIERTKSADNYAINDLPRDRYVIYPNPTTHWINIVPKSKSVIQATYSLHNVTGKVLMTGKADKINFGINMSKLSAGIYILRITSTKERTFDTYKIIKE